jgi:hypothetical protein
MRQIAQLKSLSIPFLATVCMALVGCAPRVYVDQDSSARFSNLHTFAWVSPPSGEVRDPILDSQILGERVQRAVVANLTGRGYTHTTPDQKPDFIITYHTVGKEKLQTPGPSFSFGFVDAFPRGFGSIVVPVGDDIQSREQGTLMLDIIDGQSKRLVWRGWTTDWVSQDNYSMQAVTKAVDEILARFPPSP